MISQDQAFKLERHLRRAVGGSPISLTSAGGSDTELDGKLMLGDACDNGGRRYVVKYCWSSANGEMLSGSDEVDGLIAIASELQFSLQWTLVAGKSPWSKLETVTVLGQGSE